MEVALVFVLVGLVAVCLAKDFMIWRQRRGERRQIITYAAEMANWFRVLRGDVLSVRSELDLQELTRAAGRQGNRDYFTSHLEQFSEGILARLTENLKADVSTLKELIARSAKVDKDALYENAVRLTFAKKHVNASVLRKGLNIGWKRSNQLLGRLLEEKVVTQNGKAGNYLPIYREENKS